MYGVYPIITTKSNTNFTYKMYADNKHLRLLRLRHHCRQVVVHDTAPSWMIVLGLLVSLAWEPLVPWEVSPSFP